VKNLSVLIVEDHAGVRDLLRRERREYMVASVECFAQPHRGPDCRERNQNGAVARFIHGVIRARQQQD